MLMRSLRDYQAEAIDRLREAAMRGEKRVVMQAPTGAGKTMMMSDIVSRARERDKKVLITVPAISLVDQTLKAFYEQGIADIGVIQASHHLTDWSKPVQVASVQTLQSRGTLPEADVALIDECHKVFKFFEGWFLSEDNGWRDKPIVGFSATPWTKGLGSWFTHLIQVESVAGLIARNVLVPYRTFAPDAPDLSGVRTIGGEFVEADLDAVMRPKKLVANIVETWRTLADNRPTIAFCCSIAHAEQLAQEFSDNGVPAASMNCNTPLKAREAIYQQVLRGEIKVVCNVDVVGIGVDWPLISCVIYARPTMSDMRYVQNIGRGLRSAPGKTDLLILDHSTTTQRLGFLDDVYARHDCLDDGRTKAKDTQIAMAMPQECKACHYLKPPRTPVCPHCGHRDDKHSNAVMVERGTLKEIKQRDKQADWREQLPDKRHCYGQLYWYAQHMGFKLGYAAVKVKEIFGAFPKQREPDPDTIERPAPELLAYLDWSKGEWIKAQKAALRRETEANRRLAEQAVSEREVP